MKLLMIALFIMLSLARAEAQTWYVNGTTGHDTNNDCTEAQNPNTPKRTITNALDQCFTYGLGEAADMVLEVAAGTYAENISRVNSFPRGSSMNAPFTMRAATGATVIIRPNGGGQVFLVNSDPGWVPFNAVIQGFTFDGTNIESFASVVAFGSPTAGPGSQTLNMRWIGNTFLGNNLCTSNTFMTNGLGLEFINNTMIGSASGPNFPNNCGGYFVYTGGDGALFEGNEFSGMPYYAMHVFQTTGCPSNNIIRHNIFRDHVGDTLHDAGIVTCGNGHQVHSNLFYNLRGGIDAYINTGQTGVEYDNNTIYNVSRFGIHYNSSSPLTARNNIIYNSGSAPSNGYFYTQLGAPLTASNNLCGHAGTGCNDVGNPLFVDAANGNFQLQAGSPAINAGLNLYSEGVTTDFFGIARPSVGAFEIGALEQSGAAAEDVWYVATTGNNANTCEQAKNPNTPKQTINNALDNCFTYGAGEGANKVLEIAGGTYVEHLNRFFNFPKGSSWNAPFTMRGKANETAIIRPSFSNQGVFYFHDQDLGGPFFLSLENVTIDKSQMLGEDNAINVFASDVRLDGVTLHSVNWGCGILAAGDRLWVRNSTIRDGEYYSPNSTGGLNCYPVYANGADVLFENNVISHFPRYAFHIYRTSPPGCPAGSTVRYNTISGSSYSPDNDAAIVVCGNNHKVYSNVIYDVRAGIDTYITTSQTGVEIYNNTIYGSTLYCLGYNSAGVTFRNNICYNTPAQGIPNYPAANHSGYYWNTGGSGALTANHNLCGHAGCDDMLNGGIVGTGTTITGNPLFVDAANGDFRLCQEAGVPHPNCTGQSPAIDAGATLASPFNLDLNGTQRPVGSAFDIGAIEAGVTDPAEPDPLVALRLSCDNTVQDASGNNNHGTLTGGATYTSSPDGKFNQACLFDGVNDSVTVAAHSTLDFTHGFHLGAWVYPTSKTANALIIGKNPSRYFLFASLDGYCGNDAIVAGFDTPSGGVIACYATGLTLNTWQRVDVSYNRSQVIIYINGKPVTSTAASAFIEPSTGTMQIGGSTFNEHFTGRIDEPYAGNTALSEAQIASLMNSPVNPVNVVSSITLGSGTLKLNAGAAAIKVR